MLWVTILASVTTVLLIVLYKRSLNECYAISDLLLMVLIDDEVRSGQRASLISFVATSQAQNAHDLGGKVLLAMANHATQMHPSIALGVAGHLWKLKTDREKGCDEEGEPSGKGK